MISLLSTRDGSTLRIHGTGLYIDGTDHPISIPRAALLITFAARLFRTIFSLREKRTETMQHTYAVTIEGIAPLIQNNPALAIEAMHKNSHRKKSPSVEPSEDWRVKVYLDTDGKTLQHPSMAMESVLREAAGSFKAKGRGSMKVPVKRSCFVDGDWMKISNRKEPDHVKEMHPRNSMGQLVSSYLPEFAAGWRMDFTLVLTEDDIISPSHLKEILDYAGARIGLGVARPKYGRFMVVKFEEQLQESAAAD